MARPKKVIDKSSFEKLCALQCTEEEICSFLDITDKTLTAWCKSEYNKSFSEIFKIKREIGKMSLRRNQFRLAETNPTMAIWLGKQYLGQKDNKDIVLKQTISQEAINDVEEFMNSESEDAVITED